MKIKRILVIRFRRVGDAILSSALCASLHKMFPEAEIHYVLNKEIAPLFYHHPDIDKVIPFAKEDMDSFPSYLKKVRSVMKANDYDIIVDTRSTVKTLFFSLFSLKTKYRIGRKKGYNFFIQNHRVDNFPNGTRSQISLTLDLLDPLSKEFNVIKDDKFSVKVTQEEKISFRRYMEKEGIDFSKPIMICGIASRLEYKMWDKDKMLALLNNILTTYPEIQLIFNYGGDREKVISTDIYYSLNSPSNIFINIEAKDLRELPAMLSNADFFFGIEGGPRHMAQALNVPAFAIYPPGIKMIEWLPNPSGDNQGISVKEINEDIDASSTLSYEEKYAHLTVEAVWNRLNKMQHSLFGEDGK